MKLLVVFLCGLIPLVLGVGEPTPQKELDPEILKFALQQLATNDGDNSLYHQKAVKVTNVSTQVVAGTNYRFTVHLVDTECLKSSGQEPTEDCAVQEDAPVKECRLTVWSKPWENFMKLTAVDCGEAGSQGNNAS